MAANAANTFYRSRQKQGEVTMWKPATAIAALSLGRSLTWARPSSSLQTTAGEFVILRCIERSEQTVRVAMIVLQTEAVATA